MACPNKGAISLEHPLMNQAKFVPVSYTHLDVYKRQAPGAVESCVPGIVVGAFLDDGKSGRLLPAQAFTGMTLEDAVKKAREM